VHLFRLFLSSPGDCAEERQLAHDVVARLNADPLVNTFSHIEAVAWDQGNSIPMELLASPQASVDRHLPTPESCDVFVGIFNCRLGTPLPIQNFRKFDGTPFQSGTEYEFHRSWEQRRRGASHPEMLIYRRQRDSSDCADKEQFDGLEAFFGKPPFKDNRQWIGSVDRYKSPADFADKLEAHLRKFLSQRQPGSSPPFDTWLWRQAELIKADAGPRYTADAHVDGDIGQVFDWLLARQSAITAMDKALSEVWKEIVREEAFGDLRDAVAHIAQQLRGDPLWHDTPDFDTIRGTFERVRERAWEAHRSHEKNEDQAARSDDWKHREYQLRQCAYKAGEVLELLEAYSRFTRERVMLLTGPAGQGKTHTLVHEIQRTVAASGVALGILCQTLSATGNLWDALCARLGWPGSHEQLLDKLESEAVQRHQRALLVIDALNETPDRPRWRKELLGMVQEILLRPHLALAISVRSDYLDVTLPALPEKAEAPWVVSQHPGFSGIEPDALLRYFDHYQVKAPVAPPLGEFANPLYVQLLAKSMQGRPLRHWLPSWLEVWQAWMDRLEEEARDKLALDDASRRQTMHRIMRKLAEAMLESGGFSLSRHQADAIAFEIARVDRVIDFLCSAGALIDRLDGDEDVVEFGFERLSDTFLADRLMKALWNGVDGQASRREALRAAFAPGGMLQPLATDQWMETPLHYRRAGLLEALCLATPRETGVELPVLMPPSEREWTDWALDTAFTDSLRWRARPEEFGADRETLRDLWEQHQRHDGIEGELDELIRFAMIPGHPLAMENLIHPKLLAQDSPGVRDAIWSIHLVPLWFYEHSNLRQLVTWARDANLHEVQADVALPAARLLAWMGATSQNELRRAAMQGLTRLLVACPQVLEAFLPDFLEVNDAYVLEGVLVAVWGVVLDGADREMAVKAAMRVYETQFPEGNARWCHVTLRHYARCIVEAAHGKGWLEGIDLDVVRPPYRSALQLEQVPALADLEGLDDSHGFWRLINSCTSDDFHLYVMGGNSSSLPFSSQSKPDSTEPMRPFMEVEGLGSWHPDPGMFDLALTSRFVAWNCLQLGWSGERFDTFDTGHYTEYQGRFSREGHTERIGKKYQWIGWHTWLGFLSDNYEMRPGWRDDEVREYDNPSQVDVHLHDPSRWLQVVRPLAQSKDESFWRIPSQPTWPLPDIKAMVEWVASDNQDLLPADVIAHAPELPRDWRGGDWLCLAAEHTWTSHFAPGQWALDNGYHADIWWQSWPLLIRANDFPVLLDTLRNRSVWEVAMEDGRLDPDQEWDVALSAWPALDAAWDQGFVTNRNNRFNLKLPIPWRPLIGACGHPDRRDEHRPVLLPVPSLFREWVLELDLRRGLVLYKGEPLFGLAGWVHGENALFARQQLLQALLVERGYTLFWSWRGERRGFMDFGMHRQEDGDLAWADYHGIGYLGTDGRVQTARIEKKLLKRQ
jgi:hypothetical protein